MGKEEEHGDEANALLAKKELDHVTIGIIGNSVLGERETKVHCLIFIILICIVISSIVILSRVVAISGVFLRIVVSVLDEVSFLVEVIAKLVLGIGGGGQCMVPVCI